MVCPGIGPRFLNEGVIVGNFTLLILEVGVKKKE
jgi:hypothetical protein